MASFTWEVGTIATLLDTGLNSVANNSAALSSAYDPSLYPYGLFELVVGYGTNPTIGNVLSLYLIPTIDGTNYPNGTSGASPQVQPPLWVGNFVVAVAATAAQRLALVSAGNSSMILLPPTLFKAQLVNKGGQTLAATSNTLKILPYRLKSA